MRLKRKAKPKNQKVRNATPIIYDGINFKSKLEAYCYRKLKENNLLFSYEEIVFDLVPSFNFEKDSFELSKRKGVKTFGLQRNHVRAITYTPDFVGKGWIIETKGNPNDVFPLKWKLFKYYIHNNQLDYDLYMPRNQKQIDEVIEIIKSKHGTYNH